MYHIIILLLIGFVILAHEAGHFFAARLVKMPVAVFSIGFGPALFRFRRGETEYRICMIPLGGYVMPQVQDEEEFFSFPCNSRIVMTLGGPAASLLLPFIIFSALNAAAGGFTLHSLLVKPFMQVYTTLGSMLCALPLMFSHPRQLTGIVGIVSQGGQFVGGSAVKAFKFMAFLSLNLALLNLLPFPVLDGGKVVLYLLEKIHRPLQRLHMPLVMAGWIILMGLMVYVTIYDVLRLCA